MLQYGGGERCPKKMRGQPKKDAGAAISVNDAYRYGCIDVVTAVGCYSAGEVLWGVVCRESNIRLQA